MNNGVYIDGPLNIITISNKNMNKRMTIIADYHEDVEKETDCNRPDSIKLEQFIEYKLHDSMKKNKVVHIFIETLPSNHTNGLDKDEMRYADKVIRYLLKTFHQPNVSEGITMRSNRFPNVTLHFVDIRNLIFMNMDRYYIKIVKLMTQIGITSNISPEIINEVREAIKPIRGLVMFTYKSMYELNDVSSIELQRKFDIMTDEQIKAVIAMRLIVHKLSSSYKDKETKDKINKYIRGEFKENFDKFFALDDELTKFLDELEKNKNENKQWIDDDGGIAYGKPYLQVKEELCKLDELLYKLNSSWFVDITSKMMDIYTIRMFLNKDIESAIAFTGIEHSMFLLYFLVKFFDFDIDSVSLLNDITKEELVNKIKTNTDKGFHKYLFPKKLVQCATDDGFTVV